MANFFIIFTILLFTVVASAEESCISKESAMKLTDEYTPYSMRSGLSEHDVVGCHDDHRHRRLQHK